MVPINLDMQDLCNSSFNVSDYIAFFFLFLDSIEMSTTAVFFFYKNNYNGRENWKVSVATTKSKLKFMHMHIFFNVYKIQKVRNRNSWISYLKKKQTLQVSVLLVRVLFLQNLETEETAYWESNM